MGIQRWLWEGCALQHCLEHCAFEADYPAHGQRCVPRAERFLRRMSRAYRVEVRIRLGEVGEVEGGISRFGTRPAGRGERPDDAVGRVQRRERLPGSLDQDAPAIWVRFERGKRGRGLGAWPSQVCFKSVHYGATTAWPSPVLSAPLVQWNGVRRKGGMTAVSDDMFTLIAYLLMVILDAFVVTWHGKHLSTLKVLYKFDLSGGSAVSTAFAAGLRSGGQRLDQRRSRGKARSRCRCHQTFALRHIPLA